MLSFSFWYRKTSINENIFICQFEWPGSYDRNSFQSIYWYPDPPINERIHYQKNRVIAIPAVLFVSLTITLITMNKKRGQYLLSSIYNFVQARSPTVFIDLCETRKALIAGIILRPLKISVVWTCSDPGLDRSLCASSCRQSRSHILTPSVLAHTFLQRQRRSLLCIVQSSWNCSSL